MLRMIAIAAVIVLCVAAGVGTMLYLAYGLAEGPPRQIHVEGMSDSAFVATYRNGAASIRAQSRSDAYAALGYLHAVEHGWTMTLWQRTARGQLSAWLGDGLLPLDHLTRRLGLARLAEEAYRALPEDERSLLDAYARGANSTLPAPGPAHHSEFSVLRTAPERWEPWYTLAVNRLLAWLATPPPPSDSLRDAPERLRTFYEADHLLRQWLHLHGFESSMAWTLQDSVGTSLIQRHVVGSSALPVFQEVELSYPGADPIAGATLIGTPFMPAGRSGTHAWAVLLSGTATLLPTMRDTAAATYVHERIASADGREYVLRIQRTSGELFFESDAPGQRPAPPDSLATPARAGTARFDSAGTHGPGPAAGWVLQWPGLQPVSDVSAWLGLPGEAGSAFLINDGDGLSMTRDGAARVLGTPLFTAPHAHGVAVGNASFSRYAAERLDSVGSMAGSAAAALTTLSDVHSAWAAALAPSMIDAAVSVPDQPALVAEALAYLRNWDFRYDRASIAASIFDMWARAYRDSVGHLPEAVVPDTALGINLVRYAALIETVGELATRFGEDPSQWRWEEIQPHRYHFPVWSNDSLFTIDAGRLSRTRYASILIPGAGHVTTLSHGPSTIRRGLEAPARWEGWTSTANWGSFHFRARRFPVNRFFGRYLVSDRTPDPADIAVRTEMRSATTLLPQ